MDFKAHEALRVALRESRDDAMAGVLLDLERARMQSEDFRAGACLQTKDPRFCRLTWRDFGQEQNERNNQLCTRIGEAMDVLGGVHHRAAEMLYLTADVDSPLRRALRSASQKVLQAEYMLEGGSDDDVVFRSESSPE